MVIVLYYFEVLKYFFSSPKMALFAAAILDILVDNFFRTRDHGIIDKQIMSDS